MLINWKQDSETDNDTAKTMVERARTLAYELSDIIGDRAAQDGVTQVQKLGYANYGESLSLRSSLCIRVFGTDALQNRLWGTPIKLDWRLSRIIQGYRPLRRSMIPQIYLTSGSRLRLRERQGKVNKV
jgi:hypothetical protein